MIRGRDRRNHADLSDTLSLSGWIYADLLLGLMILFLASAVGINPLKIGSYSPEAKTATAEAIALAAIPTSTFTPTATPDWAATDTAADDILATAVAATMAAIQTETGVPTSTPFPTPEPTDDVGATQTVIARQIVRALALTLTAAPTSTATPTLTTTPTPRATRNLRATRTAVVNRIATSVAATLTAEPTSTAGPTPTPRPTTNADATETAIAEVVLEAIEATLVAERPALLSSARETAEAVQIATAFIATLTAEPGTATPVATLVAGLSRDPVTITFPTNADALLQPNTAAGQTESARVRQEIRNAFSQYSGTRQAGIVLTFGTSPSPGEGNELSRAFNQLLQQELPDLFNRSVLNDYHIISGNTNLRGNVEVEVYLVAE